MSIVAKNIALICPFYKLQTWECKQLYSGRMFRVAEFHTIKIRTIHIILGSYYAVHFMQQDFLS